VIEYRHVDEVTEDFAALTRELGRECAAKNGEAQEQYNQFNALAGMTDVVLVYDGTELVGGGSFKHLDGSTAEVKRVFVRTTYRGRGIAKELMRQLEARGVRQGYRRFILETSRTFTEAIGCITGWVTASSTTTDRTSGRR
jgi:putative acetyltransferase